MSSHEWRTPENFASHFVMTWQSSRKLRIGIFLCYPESWRYKKHVSQSWFPDCNLRQQVAFAASLRSQRCQASEPRITLQIELRTRRKTQDGQTWKESYSKAVASVTNKRGGWPKKCQVWPLTNFRIGWQFDQWHSQRFNKAQTGQQNYAILGCFLIF